MPQGTRRGFLSTAIGTVSGLLAVSAAYPVFRFLWPPAETPGGEGRIGIPLEDMLVGQTRMLQIRGEPVLLVREAGRIAAVSAVCTHLGCLVKYKGNGQIACPCHAAEFDLDGNVKSGPAPRPLPSIPVRIEGKKIVVGS